MSDDWMAEIRKEIAEARARETPQQRVERERQEAERQRGLGDGSRDRTRQRHGLLWYLLHPFGLHRRRYHRSL